MKYSKENKYREISESEIFDLEVYDSLVITYLGMAPRDFFISISVLFISIVNSFAFALLTLILLAFFPITYALLISACSVILFTPIILLIAIEFAKISTKKMIVFFIKQHEELRVKDLTPKEEK